MIIEDGYYRPGATEYTIVKKYFENGQWQNEVILLEDTRYIVAAMETSRIAKELDEKFGDSHFWTVDLKTVEGSSYFQLFHGRTE